MTIVTILLLAIGGWLVYRGYTGWWESAVMGVTRFLVGVPLLAVGLFLLILELP